MFLAIRVHKYHGPGIWQPDEPANSWLFTRYDDFDEQAHNCVQPSCQLIMTNEIRKASAVSKVIGMQRCERYQTRGGWRLDFGTAGDLCALGLVAEASKLCDWCYEVNARRTRSTGLQ